MNEKIIAAAVLIINATIFAIVTYKILKKYVEPEQPRKPIKFKTLVLALLPLTVLMAGALLAKLTGQLLGSFIVSIVLSMGILAANTYRSKELGFAQEVGITAWIGYILTRLIPFTIFYFFNLLMVYGFNFGKMLSLFNFR
jgi:hypothetical protein